MFWARVSYVFLKISYSSSWAYGWMCAGVALNPARPGRCRNSKDGDGGRSKATTVYDYGLQSTRHV